MAYYCNVSRQTIYNWLNSDSAFFDKELAEKVDKLRARPILKARQTITKSLDDPNHAFRYLERKRRKEFAPNVDLTSDGQALMVNVISFDANRNNTPQLQGPDGVSA
jgi:hypothetical protein